VERLPIRAFVADRSNQRDDDSRIMEKLNLHSINDLVRFAVRNGVIE